MDIKALAKNLLNIAEKAAPLVGLGEEVEAGKALIEAVRDTIAGVKEDFDNEDQAALQSSLDALVERVNAHANSTIDRLNG